MRLAVVESGHRLKQKLILKMIRLLSGHPAVDIIRTIFYRPEFWGKPFSSLVQATLRGPSQWTVGERELFAAFASRLNECKF